MRQNQSLSLDLRQRMVDAYKAGEGTLQTVADRFKVSRSSLWRLLRQDRVEGNLEAKQRGGGKKPRVYGDHEVLFKELVKANQDWTLAEIRDGFREKTGIYMSISTTDATCRRLNLTKVKAYLRKKAARTLEDLYTAIQEAFRNISPQDLRGWFKHCGYRVQ